VSSEPVTVDADIAEYGLRIGDDALILAQRLSEWAARSPQIEEDVALMNIALDLLGQARTLLSYAGAREGRRRDEDDLAYLRDEAEFRNVALVELANGDFAVTMVRQLLFSAYQCELYRRLVDSADPTLAAIAGKAVKEVDYHRDHAEAWVRRLGDGTEESHARTQAALEATWPYHHELFEDDSLTARLAGAGLAPAPGSLRDGWADVVLPLLGKATLAVPENTWAPTGGRRGQHTEAFGYLLAELQHLHRSHPGASW